MRSHVQRYAIWLLPAQPDRDELQNRIQLLSQRFSAIPFPPHLTLFAGANQPLPTIEAVLEIAVRNLSPLTLQSTGLQVSPAFFQTLFVEFAPHPDLSALAEQLQQALDPSSMRPFHPHLSLLYHELPLPQKEALRAQLHWAARAVRFDAVSIVFPPRGEDGWADIAAWKTMDTYKLR